MIPYAKPCYGQEEIDAVADALRDTDHLAPGPRVREFEARVAELFGMRYGVMTNSGSSANLLALAALDLPKGATVVTPACTFATTVAPIVQLGLAPEFVDVGVRTFVTDKEYLPAAHAYMLPWLLGNKPVSPLRLNEPLIYDMCDTIPSGPVNCDVATTSFYASHVITAAGGGGMVMFNDKALYERAKLLTYWGRQSAISETDNIAVRYLNGYDNKFMFAECGYNFQPIEAQAAFGLVQLDRLEGFLERRRSNFSRIYNALAPYSRNARIMLPKLSSESTNWLAFPIIVGPYAPFTRYDLVHHLETNGVQTRPIMAGNITRHPGFGHLAKGGKYPASEAIYKHGLLVGCHQSLTDDDLGYMISTLKDFLDAKH